MRVIVVVVSFCTLTLRPEVARGQVPDPRVAGADSALSACVAATAGRRADASVLAARADTLARRLVEALPREAPARVTLARVLLQCELPLAPVDAGWFFAEAERHLGTALDLDPTYWPARFSLAIALSRVPDDPAAARDAVSQLEALLAPGVLARGSEERGDALLLLGDLHLRLGRGDAAASAWRRGADEFPADGRFRERLARAPARP